MFLDDLAPAPEMLAETLYLGLGIFQPLVEPVAQDVNEEGWVVALVHLEFFVVQEGSMLEADDAQGVEGAKMN